MQLTPEFLPVGSIVEYNYNDSINPDWKPVILDALHMIRIFQHWNTYKHHYRPILLTEKILTEWCGFEKCLNGYWCPLEYINVKLHDSGTYSIYTSGGDTNLASKGVLALHQLQHLYSALTQTVLPIKIK